MLGSQVLLAAPDELAVVGTDLKEAPGVDAVGVDLAQPEEVAALFEQFSPLDGVIHTAAYTAVDKAEEEVDLARRANSTACQVVAQACERADVAMVVVSTDFVFDGRRSSPYPESAPTNPLGVYGRTKLEGEQAARAVHPEGARIVRTQWLYGPRGQHFPKTIQRLARERDSLRVVHDQIGVPTSTLELAPALWEVLRRGEAGIYHAACSGQSSWYDFAVAVVEYSGIEGVTVEPCTTEEFPRPAPRPAYSVLDSSKLEALRGEPLAPWQDALKTFLGNEDL